MKKESYVLCKKKKKALHITGPEDLKNESLLKSHILDITNVNSFMYELQVSFLYILYA